MQFYCKVAKNIPHNDSIIHKKEVDVNMMTDSGDHVSEKETWRSRTGYMIFCNMVLIDWLLKRQDKIEGSVFGVELLPWDHL